MDIVTQQFFSAAVSYAMNENHETMTKDLPAYCLKLKKKTKKGGQGWLANGTYNTIHSQYDLLTDKTFEDLNNWVFQKIGDYMKCNFIKSNVIPMNAWFNLYNKGDYQEFHLHTGSVLSAIYFLKSPKGGSKVWFKAPMEDMLELQYFKNDPYAPILHDSNEGKLIIFRSHINHAVEQHKLKEPRISLAYNFKMAPALNKN